MLHPPVYVDDEAGEPERMALVLWVESSIGLVVAQGFVEPGSESVEEALVRILRKGAENVTDGGLPLPERLRVADANAARALRGVLANDPTIVVGPTPEIDEVASQLFAFLGESGEEGSYLEQGRIPADLVGAFFDAVAEMRSAAPWEHADDTQILRLDVPHLGVEGACVAITGQLDLDYGFAFFDSIDDYWRFLDAPEPDLSPASRASIDMGAGWLGCSLVRAADLSETMRRECAAHRWRVVDAKSHPRLDRFERDGASRPLVARDYEIATACASGLAQFCRRHASALTDESPEPICESYQDEAGHEVRITLPAEAGPLFEVNVARPGKRHRSRTDSAPPPEPPMRSLPSRSPAKASRGRRSEEADPSGTKGDGGPRLAAALLARLAPYAERRFGLAWLESSLGDFRDPDEVSQFSYPMALYGLPRDGRTLGEWFLAERGRELPARERRWLEAQTRSWLSVWTVEGAVPGESIELLDRLTGERRVVVEATASRSVERNVGVLARVIDFDGRSLLSGVHPRPLPPLETADLVRRARARLGRRSPVGVERLRTNPDFARYLIRRWESDVEALLLRAARPPDLRNSDGDPILPTIDHFRFASTAQRELERRIATIEGVDPEVEREGAAATYAVLADAPQSDGRLVVRARLDLRPGELRVETNSIARADAIRAQIEAVASDLVHHRIREHFDPASGPNRAAAANAPPPPPPPPAVAQLILDFKQRHYADWADHPLPALDGRTPREAVRTKSGRERVAVLLRDMEYRDRQRDGEAAFDFSVIRRELGIEA